jgi:pyruvate/2-oxoglutarate dehydrogenase complex dihydrolipoamide dehydrogenase (E3) component
MIERIDTDICVIGAGSGGLTVAAGASQMGAATVLIERGRMGGDCLNAGCVPSKSLLAAAAVAETARRGAPFGVTAPEVVVDFAQARRHVQSVIAEIAPTDSIARFTGLGVRVIKAQARFVGPREVAAGGAEIRARRFVLATGSAPLVPPIPGLADVPYLTNESVFDNPTRPEHLIVVGGGPVGVELAQAHRRLGTRVTVVEVARILGAADPELAEVVRVALVREGIEMLEGAAVTAVRRGESDSLTVVLEEDGHTREIAGSHILVAVGRKPNVDDLGLDVAGVAHDRRGVRVDSRLRTSNKRISAIGDVIGAQQFTHLAAHHAGIVLRNALFRLPARAGRQALPLVTFADPELAEVGLGESAARAARPGKAIRILRWPFSENDRARAERRTAGLIKVVTTAKGRILGAGIVGAHAGELIQPWVLAIDNRLKIGAMASAMVAYPTYIEVGKRAAGSYYAARLFSERTKSIVRFLARFG